jgi:AraC-like DNA-binding protein
MAPTADAIASYRHSKEGPLALQPHLRWSACGGPAARRACRLADASSRVDIAVAHLAPSDASPRSKAGVCVERVTVAGGLTARRTPELLADGNDDVTLHIQDSGRSVMSQLGREATTAVGGGVLSSNADVSAVVLSETARIVAIGLPRKLMMSFVPALEETFVQPLPKDLGVLRLLISYLDILHDAPALQTPELQLAAATHIHDLCAIAIGATRDAAEIARGRGLRAARLRAIKSDVVRNLGDQSLSAAVIGQRHRVTPRYVHKLFEGEGTTVAKFVLGLRLERVYRMLRDPRYGHRTIGALAFDAGFADLSTFNRAFRHRHGATPSDIRAAARC